MSVCSNYYIDEAGQGFTVPRCSLGNSIEECRSMCNPAMSMVAYCNGNFDKCDIIKEVKSWEQDNGT
ncbi:MAG: hypothetical protein KBS43_04635 [Oscillospiraceae bacterium]|nr:hypothetical protein [Candidatus Limimonas coprohippi]